MVEDFLFFLQKTAPTMAAKTKAETATRTPTMSPVEEPYREVKI